MIVARAHYRFYHRQPPDAGCDRFGHCRLPRWCDAAMRDYRLTVTTIHSLAALGVQTAPAGDRLPCQRRFAAGLRRRVEPAAARRTAGG